MQPYVGFYGKNAPNSNSAGAAPDPAGGAYSTPPDTLAVFMGPTSKGREKGREGEGKGKGRGGKGRGGKRKGEGRERGGRGTSAPSPNAESSLRH